MTSIEELDQLIRDRFNFSREDLVAALRTVPAHRPWATRLTAGEAELLDAAGFTEDLEAYAAIAGDLTAHMGRLYNSALTPGEVASALGVNDSRIRQRRLNNTLWAIDDGGKSVFPMPQFEEVIGPDGEREVKHVRGLDRVLPHLLPLGFHPTAVAGFLQTPQPELLIDGRPTTVRQWLLNGEPVEPVLRLLEIGEWASA